MDLNRSLWAPVLIAALIVPPASAAPGEVETQAIELGYGELRSTLDILLTRPAAGDELDAAGMSMQAASLDVEMDSVAYSVYAGPTGHSIGNGTQTWPFRDAHLDIESARREARIIAVPTGDTDLIVDFNCGSVEPADGSFIHRNATIAHDWRDAIVVDTRQSAAWSTCGEATATLRGDFTLVLWDVDFTVESGRETRSFTTGRGQPEGLEDMPDTRTVLSRDQEAWIRIGAGSIDVPLSPAWELYMAAGSTQIDSMEAARLNGASGILDVAGQRVVLDEQDAVITGDVDLHLNAVDDNRLRTSVDGRVEEIRVGGELVTIDPAAEAASPWWLLVLAVPLLFTRRVVAGYWLRRGMHAPADDAQRIEACTTVALRWWKRLGPAYMLRAYARTRIGDLHGALEDHARADRYLRSAQKRRINRREAKRSQRRLSILEPGREAQAWLEG